MALEWSEALTLLPDNDISDELFGRAREKFSEEELVNLSLAVIAINGWNRLAIPFRSVPGSYQPAR
jgi:alkylhydroperoxidase family enzyme